MNQVCNTVMIPVEELEALRRERDSFHMDYRMKCDAETKTLHGQLAAMTQERDKWMEDSLRQTKTIQRLADAAEDRNNVDKSREAFHAEQLAAALRVTFDPKVLEQMNAMEKQLAAAQAREQQLRYRMKNLADGCRIWGGEAERARKIIEEILALSLPQDDTALKQYGAKLLRDVGCKAFLQPLDFDVYLNRMAEEMTK